MEYRHLGRAGIRVSTLSFGSWVTFGHQVDYDAAKACTVAAYEAGVNFFDNAEAYAGGKSEEVMGAIFRDIGWKRSDLVVSTKIFWGGKGPNDRGLSRKHIIEGTDAALQRLQLDYVDLIFCHRPDQHTPIEETVRAMSHIIDTGRAFYWGTSEWSAEQLRQAYEIAYRCGLNPPAMDQPQYHMFHRERVELEYAPLYRDYGLGTTIWSPLASGLLTGKYNDGVPKGSRLDHLEWLRDNILNEEGQRRIEKVRKLTPIAEELGGTMAQLAIAWCAQNQDVSTVITGASRAEQVSENMKALDLLPKLTPDVLQRIDDVLDNRPQGDRDWRES